MTRTWSGSPETLGVSAHQRSFFEAYGFLTLRGRLADDFGAISSAFDEVFDDQSNPRLTFAPIGHRGEPQYAMGNFVQLHPTLSALATDPRLTSVACDLLGPATRLAGSDGSIYCCETEWHYDSPTASPDCHHIKVAVYLEPLTGETGAPRVLPGSHLLPALDGGPLEAYLGFDGGTEARTGLLGEGLPYWPLDTEPGDLVVWDYRIMHGSFGSVEPRRQFAMNFRAAAPPDTQLGRDGNRSAALQLELDALGLVAIDADAIGRLRREARSYRRLAGIDEPPP